MSLTRCFAIVLRQYYLIRGSFARFVQLFVWVGLDMILWGFMTKYMNTLSDSKTNFVPMLLGAVLLWDFLVRVMQGVTIAFFEDVWSRNFLNIFATPLKISEYLSGLVITSLASSCVGLVVMLILSTSIFGLSFFSYGLTLIPFIMILFMFGIALGIFATAIVLRLGPASEWFIWPVPALISPFIGVFYPLTVLPEWMRGVSKILPPSYVFEEMRRIVAGEASNNQSLVVGLILSAFYILLACWTFKKTYGYAIRSGLIARYSAESVS